MFWGGFSVYVILTCVLYVALLKQTEYFKEAQLSVLFLGILILLPAILYLLMPYYDSFPWPNFWPNFFSDLFAGVILGAIIALYLEGKKDKEKLEFNRNNIKELLAIEIYTNVRWLKNSIYELHERDSNRYPPVAIETWELYVNSGEIEWLSDNKKLFEVFRKSASAGRTLIFASQDYATSINLSLEPEMLFGKKKNLICAYYRYVLAAEKLLREDFEDIDFSVYDTTLDIDVLEIVKHYCSDTEIFNDVLER